MKEFLDLEIPKTEMMVTPWLPDQGLAMIYERPAFGKSWLGLSVAVAHGRDFLSFTVLSPRMVLVIDGEMRSATMPQRLRSILVGFSIERFD